MPVMPTLEAKVKDEYRMGAVIAFSGQEYIRGEWRPVPVGFEPAAIAHSLLDVREIGGEEIHVTSQDYLAKVHAEAHPEEAVTTETPEEESKPKRTRKSKSSQEES